MAALAPALYAPLVIGVGFPFSYDGDGGACEVILDAMSLHLADLQKNTSLHPAVRNATFDLVDLQLIEATNGIKGGFTLSQHNVVAAIGAGYSTLTAGLSSALNAFGIPLCDGSSTSPGLSDKQQYPNFFRTVCQDDYQAVAIVDFIVDQGWSEVAVVHSNEEYGQGIASSAQVLARARNVTVSTVQGFTPGLADYQNTVDNLKASGTRIFLFAGEFSDFVVLSNQSSLSGIFGAGYQWITTDAIYGSEFTWAPMEGLINFFPLEGQGPLYQSFEDDWAADTQLGEETATPPTPYSMFFLNCVEAYVYGFDRLFKQRPDLVPSSGQSYNLSSAIVIPDTFAFPDMDTVTGKVIYDENGDRKGVYSISFYNESADGYQPFATYDTQGVHYTGPLVYQGGSRSRPPSSSAETAVATQISGKNAAAVLIYILSPVSLLLCILCGAGTYYYRAEKVIKASSVEFLLIIIAGLMLASLYPLLLTGAPSDAKCLAEIWVLPTAFAIVMGNLMSKTFRVYRIFTNVFAASASTRNSEVVLWSSAILLSDLALSAAWTGFSKPVVSWQVFKFQGDFYERQSICVSSDNRLESIFLGAIFGWNAIILLAGVVLTILTRNIPSKFSETSSMAIVIYNFFAVTVFIVPFGYLFTITKTAQVIMKALATYCCVWVALGVLFGTKLTQITGDDIKKRASADEGAAMLTNAGAKTSESTSHSKSGAAVKRMRSVHEHVDPCYILDRRIWVPRVIHLSTARDAVIITPDRFATAVLQFPVREWKVAAAAAPAGGEAFHAIELRRTQPVKEKGVMNVCVVRFKEAEEVERWLDLTAKSTKAASAMPGHPRILGTQNGDELESFGGQFLESVGGQHLEVPGPQVSFAAGP